MSMYLKKSTWLLLFMLAAHTITATPLQKSELIDLAVKFFNQKQQANGRSVSTPLDCRFVVEQQDTLLMVLNFKEGFILMSADDAVQPVLAYSIDQQLDLDEMPPAARMWLDYYASEVRHARARASAPSADVARKWNNLRHPGAPKDQTASAVEPLLTALWNQTKYYNAYSPVDYNAPSGYDNRTPNGCVAVAMAMIMYYYRYPLHGTGSHTNYTDYGNFYVDFSQQTYCYEAMKNQLNHYNNEVAKLIFHCGTSVDMMYGTEGSGAYSENVPYALTNYFGYASTCEYLRRNDYTHAQWENMLRTELDAGRPLYYSGCSDDGCHAFVCDGYDEDSLYHFNFGWGGSSNGYYTIAQGDSSANPVGGFNNSQRIVRGIAPNPNAYPYSCGYKEIKCESGTLEDGSGYLDYANNADCLFLITEENVYRAQIVVDFFETQADHDSLSFWDGHPDQGNLLMTISGSVPSGTTYYFNTDSLYLTFKTDDSETAAGWRLSFRQARPENSCGSMMPLLDYHGELTDGSGDMQHYRFNANCQWRLYLPMASYISLTFPLMDLDEGDYLAIYDCSVSPKVQLARFTGHSDPQPVYYFTNHLIFEFISDNYLCGEGFQVNWTSDYSPAGVESLSSDEVQIFPNPATSAVHIRLPELGEDVSVVVYDITGRMVLQSVATARTEILNMDVRSLPDGFYTIMVQTDRSSVKKKLIIQR